MKVKPKTLWCHTAKAAQQDAEPIFAVVDVDQFGGAVAWKCELLADGKIKHPAYLKPLSRDDERLFVAHGPDGSEPSASFEVDSDYQPFEGCAGLQLLDAR